MKRIAIAYVVPLVCLAMGLPLVVGVVPPNGGYGYRTLATLSSDALWYATNRQLGLALVAAGSAGIGLSRVVLRATRAWALDSRIAACVSADVVLFLGALRAFLMQMARL